MVPHPQATLVPVYDARRCRTLVLESRDRDLGREHLFRFTVRFQPPQTQPSQTERLPVPWHFPCCGVERGTARYWWRVLSNQCGC